MGTEWLQMVDITHRNEVCRSELAVGHRSQTTDNESSIEGQEVHQGEHEMVKM